MKKFLYITLIAIFLLLGFSHEAVAYKCCCTDNPSICFTDLGSCQSGCTFGYTEQYLTCQNYTCGYFGGNVTADQCTNNTSCCPSGQTNPYSTCQSGSCVSVSSCGVSNCSGCGGGGIGRVYVCSTDNSQFLNLVDCQTSCLFGSCTEVNAGGCPSGQTTPHSECQAGSCVTVQSCGVSNCSACINVGGCTVTGQTNPYSTCQSGSCVSVSSCGVSNCSGCGGGAPVLGGGSTVTLTNPLKWDTFEQLINAIIDFMWMFGIAVVPMVIIIAGYFFVTSMGDPAKVSQAKKMVLYALIGLLIIGMAKGIVTLIQKVFK